MSAPFNYDPEEPEAILLSGERVNEALFDSVLRLLRRGHTITVSEDGHVSIVPPIHPDDAYSIQASPSATRAILADVFGSHTHH
jgi:hypothetical protein